MKKKYNKLTCLFGHHDYSEEVTMDKHGNYIYLCQVCKRRAHWKGFEIWIDYDKEGNIERWEEKLKDGGKIMGR